MQFKIYLFPALIAISFAQGCSFSESSKSSSESSSASSGSISKSSASILSSPSSSLTEEEIYQNDITDFTSSYLKNKQFNHATFSKGISEIASANGVTSWEQDEATLVAIGRGLKEANLPIGVSQTYISGIADSNSLAQQLIQKGYDGE